MSALFSYYAKRIPNLSKKVGVYCIVIHFPSEVSNEAATAFKTLKTYLRNANLIPLTVALATVLSQDGLSIACLSPALSDCERRYSAVEKEATTIAYD